MADIDGPLAPGQAHWTQNQPLTIYFTCRIYVNQNVLMFIFSFLYIDISQIFVNLFGYISDRERVRERDLIVWSRG